MVSKWRHEYQVVVEVVVVDDAFVAKMSSGDVDVEPYLDSRNTKGYSTATQILKLQSSNCVMQKWKRYEEVYMVYGEHRNKIWWNLGGVVEVVRTFCRSRKFRARRRVRGPEVPGKAGRSGAGMSGLDRKFRWSGFCQEQRLGDRGFGRKNLGKSPNPKGEKMKLEEKRWGG